MLRIFTDSFVQGFHSIFWPFQYLNDTAVEVEQDSCDA